MLTSLLYYLCFNKAEATSIRPTTLTSTVCPSNSIMVTQNGDTKFPFKPSLEVVFHGLTTVVGLTPLLVILRECVQ